MWAKLHSNIPRHIPLLLALLVLLLGLVVSAWFLSGERRDTQLQLERSFSAAADQLLSIVSSRLGTYQGAMRGVQGFFRASDQVTPEDFRAYVSSLQSKRLLPGIQALAYVELLTTATVDAHVSAMRADVAPDYRITPPGTRARYAPISYIEPLADNRAALGFDVFTNPAARTAMEQALLRNDVTITERLTLVQDQNTSEMYSFVMYLPVYTPGAALDTVAQREAAIRGWVDVPFRMEDLMAGLAGSLRRDLYFEIHDGEPGPASRMYRSEGQDGPSPAHLWTQREINVAGRQWVLVINSTPEFDASVVSAERPWLVLATGTALTLLLALLVGVIARARYSAEARFRKLFAQAADGILVFDSNYRIAEANTTALRMLGYSHAELLDLSLPDLLSEEQHLKLADELATIEPGKTYLAEWQHRNKQGEVFPAEVSASRLDSGIYFTILRDLTQHKKAQQRIYRLTQLYKALSATNHAVLRRGDSEELFPIVCEIAVEYGGMTLAWVGQLRETDGRLVPVASHGRGLSYIDELHVSANADEAIGQGPTGLALRQNHPVIVNDYLADPRTALWHQLARDYGWHSAASFPIPRGGKPFAVLSVYHSHPDAFDADAIALLTEMTGDISFALDNFDSEKARRETERALVQSEARLSTILENVGACIYLKDNDGRYLYANQQTLTFMGVTAAELIGNSDEPFFDAEAVAQFRANDARVLQGGEIIQREESNVSIRTGQMTSFWSVKLPLRWPDGTIYALCGISTDITESKAREDRIQFLSNYDTLTSLPNRMLLQDRAQVALATAMRSHARVAVLYIDLDRFKIINESLGVNAGDQLLQQFSARLSASLQADQTLCRQGADVFILLLPDSDAEEAAHRAKEILDLTAQPFVVNEQRLVLTACVGIALFPDDAEDFGRLAQSADAALFRAKKSGPNNFQFFTPQMHAQAIEVLQIEFDLRQALEDNQLVLHYQPQIDIATRRIIGVEALVRWQHPQWGLVFPGRFIRVAEESGQIIAIGSWVLQEAIRQTMEWQAAGLAVVPVAVNLSAVQFRQPDFYASIVEALRVSRLDPALLELELTEGIAMENSLYTEDLLEQLHALGVSLAIDDFGIGYSSLSYLKRYRIHTLKIDQSFVQGLGRHKGDEAIVNAIIGMARSLGFKTLAEGVETQQQLDFLENSVCDQVQGYMFSRPVPAEVFAKLLRKRI